MKAKELAAKLLKKPNCDVLISTFSKDYGYECKVNYSIDENSVNLSLIEDEPIILAVGEPE